MGKMTAYCLVDRDEVLRKAIEMTESAKTHLYGMGRDLTWLDDGAFREAVNRRVTLREGGGLDMLVIAASRTRKATEEAATFHDEIKAGVGFADFGQVRVVLCDGEKLLLGFPSSPGVPEDIDDVSFGLYIEDHRFAQWLEQRFLDTYTTCEKVGQTRLENFRVWLRQNRHHAAFTLAVTVVSFVGGVLASILLR